MNRILLSAAALFLGNMAASSLAFSDFSGARAWYAATFRFAATGGWILGAGLFLYVLLRHLPRVRAVAVTLMAGGGSAFLSGIMFSFFLKLAA